MRAWLAVLGIGVGGLLPTRTRAEEPPDAGGDQRGAEARESANVPPEGGAREVPIHAMLLVSTDDELPAHIDLYPDGGRHDPLSVSYTPGCVDKCLVMAPPGRYRVVMSDPGGRLLERPTRLELYGDTRFELRPPRVRRCQRWFGVATASTLALAVGGVMIGAANTAILFERELAEEIVEVGGFLVFTGVVVAPVSWLRYAHARHPTVKARPLNGPRSR